MNLQKNAGRSCGECNACCKVFAVPEANKNDGNWCQHCEIGKGCRIYTKRPVECQLFACLWLNGMGDESFRPDRIGVMIDVTDLQLGERVVGVMHFYEMREDALKQPIIQEMVELNKDAKFIVVLHHILTESTYRKEVSMRRSHFSAKEAEILKTIPL